VRAVGWTLVQQGRQALAQQAPTLGVDGLGSGVPTMGEPQAFTSQLTDARQDGPGGRRVRGGVLQVQLVAQKA
jgi:hypothetical protein